MPKLKQILSNETPNDYGVVVLSDGIDWSRYKKNPVLMLQHDWGSVPIGKVINIRREGDNWVGELVFANTDKGREAKQLYESGFYRAVSISGYSKKVANDDKTLLFATYFMVYEISLVAIPSNPDTVSDYSEDKVMLQAVQFKDFSDDTELMSLSAASPEEKQFINQYISNMDNQNQMQAEVSERDNLATQVVAEGNPAPDINAADPALEANAANASAVQTEDADALSAKRSLFQKLGEFLGLSTAEEAPKAELTAVQELDALAANPKEPATGAQVSTDRTFDPEKLSSQNYSKMSTSFLKFIGTEEGAMKFAAAGKLASNKSKDVGSPENLMAFEAAREVINVVANDEGLMALMGNANIFLDGARKSTFSDVVGRSKDSFASGANSINFINSTPDLAVIQWLSLFFRQLFPQNTWADRCGRVSGADKAGVIWVESKMAPKVFFGDRAPVNMANYLYDDTPRGLATKVFSLQPVLFQSADLDLLGYDKMGWGQSEAMRIMTAKIHNYYLQKIAEAASTGMKVPMTGAASIPAANNFPINTAATGTLKSLTLADIMALSTKFINQNFLLDSYTAELVMDAAFFQSLLLDDKVTNILQKVSGTARPMEVEYGSFRITPRSTVAAYATSTNAVVDAELYLDGKVSMADGSVPAYTPPVLAPTTYGMALGFIPDQVLLAIGNTNVHMVSDPNSYGWKFSMDMRAGAGAARENGKGIGIITPTV